MAKATLEFDLDNSEDSQAFSRTVKATDMALVLWEIQVNLRRTFKYEDDKKWDYKTIDEMMERIQKIYEEHSINIDELIS